MKRRLHRLFASHAARIYRRMGVRCAPDFEPCPHYVVWLSALSRRTSQNGSKATLMHLVTATLPISRAINLGSPSVERAPCKVRRHLRASYLKAHWESRKPLLLDTAGYP